MNTNKDKSLDQQRHQIEKLMKNPSKPVAAPLKPPAPTIAAPPEFDKRLKGSVAGAGSDVFYTYRAAKKKEEARLRLMDDEVAKLRSKEEFEAKKLELKKKDEAKTSKNRLRRLKKKKAKEMFEKEKGKEKVAEKVEGVSSNHEGHAKDADKDGK